MDELMVCNDIVRTQRKLGVRKVYHRGFDIITRTFFVEENLIEREFLRNKVVLKLYKNTFNSFDEYYEYLDGDVYENSCYYQYNFEDKIIEKYGLNLARLKKAKSFITESINDCIDDQESEKKEIHKKQIMLLFKCLDKLNQCKDYTEFKKVYQVYEKEIYLYSDFLLYQYAFHNSNNKEKLDIIMKYMSNDYSSSHVVRGLCLIYDPEDVLDRYNYSQASDATNKKHNNELKKFVKLLRSCDFKKEMECQFDKTTHFYYECTRVYPYTVKQGRKVVDKLKGIVVYQIFKSFDEFAKHRNNDLRNCDLSENIELNVDFSNYITDDTTKFPIGINEKADYKILKMYENGMFYVKQFWYNKYGRMIYQRIHKFSYFFDFVSFLDGDLSNANLLFCEGLKNLSSIDEINLYNAKITSDICEQFGIPYTIYDYDKNILNKFSICEKSEEETELYLQLRREPVSTKIRSYFENDSRISYITDLHLMHKIENAGCKSKEDIVYVLQKIIDDILLESTPLTLFGGDISSDFFVFELFVKMLRESADKMESDRNLIFGKRNFIFILGNHEFWSFKDKSLEQIIDIYRNLLNINGMYLLHNDLFYKNEFDDMGIIPYRDLANMNNLDISRKLRYARCVILGGAGFSGYNEKLNADNGLYQTIIE